MSAHSPTVQAAPSGLPSAPQLLSPWLERAAGRLREIFGRFAFEQFRFMPGCDVPVLGDSCCGKTLTTDFANGKSGSRKAAWTLITLHNGAVMPILQSPFILELESYFRTQGHLSPGTCLGGGGGGGSRGLRV